MHGTQPCKRTWVRMSHGGGLVGHAAFGSAGGLLVDSVDGHGDLVSDVAHGRRKGQAAHDRIDKVVQVGASSAVDLPAPNPTSGLRRGGCETSSLDRSEWRWRSPLTYLDMGRCETGSLW